LIDSHCHLFMPPLGDDPAAALSRAFTDGVTHVIVPSYDAASWGPVSELTQDHLGVYAAYGLHPWAEDLALDLERLERLLRHGAAVAVGEVGLDFAVARTPETRSAQVARLRPQVELAVALGLPLILHCRRAADELLVLLSDLAPGHPGVVHGFARSPELARRFLDAGLHLGFGGMATRKGAHRVRRAAAEVPLDRILLETDAPSVGMDGLRPEQVEPGHVARVARVLAELRGDTVETICKRTSENAISLFALG